MDDQARVRVLIVDDHVMVRVGLRKLLKEAGDLELVGEAADGVAAVSEFSRLQPDVVLMDLVMPVMDGAQATARICRQSPGARIVAMTSFDQADLVRGALDAGALGCLLKDACPEVLYEAVREAAQGRASIDCAALGAAARRRTDELGRDLSPRERQVLCCLATGLTNEEIAAQLDISLGTVRVHVGKVLKKLSVPNRTAAVVAALEHGLVTTPRPASPRGPVV